MADSCVYHAPESRIAITRVAALCNFPDASRDRHYRMQPRVEEPLSSGRQSSTVPME